MRMKKNSKEKIDIKQYIGCFGNFQKESVICKKHCVLNLRCAIEYDQSAQMDLLEELVSSTGVNTKIQ